MTISAKVIQDSISDEGIRLISGELRYPRFIHAELMTHRCFSRNASSSRAIPVKKIIADIMNDTAMPIYWGKNQPGMQAKEECNETVHLSNWWPNEQQSYSRQDAWYKARDEAIRIAEAFDKAGYHKQIVNRLLEPFSHITVLITATQWSNFFALRRHSDAQPEIHELADKIYEAVQASEPLRVNEHDWHMPYILHKDMLKAEEFVKNNNKECLKFPFVQDVLTSLLIRVSIARCARVSYKTHDGKETEFEKDLELYDRLAGSIPIHASPLEHIATPDYMKYSYDRYGEAKIWKYPKLHGNFTGWKQFRKCVPNECQ